MRVIILAAGLALSAEAAAAFDRVEDREKFLDLVADKQLRLGLFGVTLRVDAEGTIEGSALGSEVTGTWAWREGYFCREMDWSGTPIPYNCQLIEERGGERIRFTVDRGDGRQATFSLR